jgi:predicted nucleotidyltransferase
MMFSEVKKILTRRKKTLLKLGVVSLSLFGSVVRNEAAETSNVDILVHFDPKKGLFAFVGLKNYLQELLKCEVDLVTKGALHPALKSKILREAKRVF